MPVVCEVARILENRRFSVPRLAGLSERLGQDGLSDSRELGALLHLITLPIIGTPLVRAVLLHAIASLYALPAGRIVS